MRRVTILTHSEFVHAKSGVHFHPTRVPTDAGVVFLGVAEVADDVADEHFAKHPAFQVEALDADPTEEEQAAAAIVSQAAEKAIAAIGEVTSLEVLRAVGNAEAAGKQRRTVLNAVHARGTALTAPPEGSPAGDPPAGSGDSA